MLISTKNPNEVPKIVRIIKYNFSTNIPEIYYCKNLSESAIKRGEKGVWQRRYYDHIIRNENDFIMTDYGKHDEWLSKINKDEEVVR